MPEVYAWPEGLLYLYTGATAQSGQPIAYVEQSRVGIQKQWGNEPSLAGTYRDHKMGQRVDFSYGAMYTFNQSAQRIFDLETAVHVKLLHNTVNGSAGYFFFSGRLSRLDFDGSNANPFRYVMAGYANLWSGF